MTKVLYKHIFDDVKRSYQFRKKDYGQSGKMMPWLLWGSWNPKWRPKNYAQFLSDGTESRVVITKLILKILEKSFQEQINIKGIGEVNLESTLAFSSIPYENAPEITPLLDNHYSQDNKKIPSKFDLDINAKRIGGIEYILPGLISYQKFCGPLYEEHWETRYKFDLGRINLEILGSSISKQGQFNNLKNDLQKIGMN